MNATQIDLDLLRIFTAVADAASFSKAAKTLGITKGTVSRAVARLEESLGTELLHRTTHSVGLSTAGSALYERTAEHLRAIVDAVGRLPERDERPSGELRLAAPHDVGLLLLPQVISAFGRRHPAVTFDVRISNDTVDLVAEGIDLAFRGAPHLPDSTLIARRLGRGSVRLYASPSYVARRGTPSSYGDPDHAWLVFRRGPDRCSQRIKDPVARCDDLQLMRELVTQGVGIGLLPPFLAQSYVVDGRLVALPCRDDTDEGETDFASGRGGLYLVYPSSGHLPPKVTAFRDFVLAGLQIARDGSVRWTL